MPDAGNSREPKPWGRGITNVRPDVVRARFTPFALTALAPFALPNVSLSAYATLVTSTAGPGWFRPENYTGLLESCVMLVTPLCAFCALAYAGPEQYSGKEMKQVAPVAAECPNWTGFYIGGFGGYKYGVFDAHVEAAVRTHKKAMPTALFTGTLVT